ncbi:hypothetical protein V6Z11_A11G381000 [Gossypium hirsutum]
MNLVAGLVVGRLGPLPSTTVHGGQNSKRVRRGQQREQVEGACYRRWQMSKDWHGRGPRGG